MNSKRGRFITFEGIDRCGKTTQVRLLKRNLERIGGANCLLTFEPGGAGKLGQAIRKLLLDPDIERDEVTASLLFAANRYEHVKKIIKPSLVAGRWVLCDRFIDSTYAYQGSGGVPRELLRTIVDIAMDGCVPDLTVLLTLNSDKRAKRSPRLDYYDQGKKSFEQRVATAFEQLAAEAPDRFIVIDGDQPRQRISKQIMQEVSKRFLASDEH